MLRFPFRMALLLGCIAYFSMPGRAQTGIYAEIGTSNFNTRGVGRQWGPTFGFYHEILSPPVVKIGFDARATLLGSDSHKAYMGLIGPNLRIHPRVIPLMPYVEGLIGVGDVNIGQGGSVVSRTAFAYEGVIGVDWTILPRIDWRVVEFSGGGFSSVSAGISPRTWSTGVVVRIP